MQQLVIKLSPEATADYLKIARHRTHAETTNDMDASGVDLDIKLSMVAGLSFADIGVNGQKIKPNTETEDLEVELLEIN